MSEKREILPAEVLFSFTDVMKIVRPDKRRLWRIRIEPETSQKFAEAVAKEIYVLAPTRQRALLAAFRESGIGVERIKSADRQKRVESELVAWRELQTPPQKAEGE